MQCTEQSETEGGVRVIYNPFASLCISLIIYFFVFCVFYWVCNPDQHVSLEVSMPSFSSLTHFPLFFSFIFSLHQFCSFPGVGGAIVCLWLVYEEHWFAQWGLACCYREGGKVWMNLQHIDPPLPPSIPKFSHHLSSSLHNPQPPPTSLFHWCVHMSVRVY